MIKTKSGARKIEGTDNWREIFDDHNYTVDALDQLADDMAIIVNGNKTAYASGAAVGQYVLLRNSTITDRADGMYKAAKVIPYNTTIDKTYLTAVSGGAINSLSDQIGNILSPSQFSNPTSLASGVTIASGGYIKTQKLVIVQIRCSITTATSNALFYLPKPLNAISGILSGTVVTLSNNQNKNISIDGNGAVLNPDANITGTTVISGVYFCQ